MLGAGGMGRVYLGRTPAGSAVAVKVVHREYAGDASFRRRFEQEVAAARRVQGLYTVPVVDADLQADEPWLATAYVPGPSLQHAIADGGPLSADAALGLVARVAEALQSIHAADVIHRDLKPSNIILTAEGPKVIDFGIARAADVTAVTATGMRTGTPAYMAPEYIRGQTVTEAGDVFALGVIAHFAATGHLAFGGGTDHGVVYRILEQAPDLDGCPEPLRAIAARCLEKDPQARPTPAEVIEQCRRAADSGTAATDTLVATSPPEAERVTPSAPIPPGGSDAHTRTAAPPGLQPAASAPPVEPGSPDARTRPAHALHAPTQVVDPDGGAATPPVSDTVPSSAGPDPDPAPGPGLPVLLGGVGVVVLAIVLIAVFLPSSKPPSRPDFRFPDYAPTAALAPTTKEKTAKGMAFSPDGRTLATGNWEAKVRLWNVASHKLSATLTAHDSVGNTLYDVSDLTFSRDGRTLAAGLDIEGVVLWDMTRHRQIRRLDAGGTVAFSPDGKMIATGHHIGVIDVWDTAGHADDSVDHFDHRMNVTDLAFSPDGKTLASAGDATDTNSMLVDGPSALLWRMSDIDRANPNGTKDPRATLDHPQTVLCLAFSPDGRTLATGSSDGRVRLWDVATGHHKATLDDDYVTSVDDLAFSPDGRTLATTAEPGVLLWNVATHKPRALLMNSTGDFNGDIKEVAFSPDGRLVAGNDTEHHRVELWKAPHSG